jgi:hypothetical protein
MPARTADRTGQPVARFTMPQIPHIVALIPFSHYLFLLFCAADGGAKEKKKSFTPEFRQEG